MSYLQHLTFRIVTPHSYVSSLYFWKQPSRFLSYITIARSQSPLLVLALLPSFLTLDSARLSLGPFPCSIYTHSLGDLKVSNATSMVTIPIDPQSDLSLVLQICTLSNMVISTGYLPND